MTMCSYVVIIFVLTISPPCFPACEHVGENNGGMLEMQPNLSPLCVTSEKDTGQNLREPREQHDESVTHSLTSYLFTHFTQITQYPSSALSLLSIAKFSTMTYLCVFSC